MKALLTSGIDVIQLGSFVNPRKVPQMADTEALFRAFPGTRTAAAGRSCFSALVLNEKGLERGLASGVELFCMGVSASKTHSQKNTGMTPVEAQRQIISMAKQAMAAGKRVQASVQSAFGCGFEGPIPQQAVLEIVKAYLDAGVRNISLADTAGHAQPIAGGGSLRRHPPVGSGCGTGLSLPQHLWAGAGELHRGAQERRLLLRVGIWRIGRLSVHQGSRGQCQHRGSGALAAAHGPATVISILQALLHVARDVSAFFQRELPGLILQSGSIVDFKGQPAEEVADEVA